MNINISRPILCRRNFKHSPFFNYQHLKKNTFRDFSFHLSLFGILVHFFTYYSFLPLSLSSFLLLLSFGSFLWSPFTQLPLLPCPSKLVLQILQRDMSSPSLVLTPAPSFSPALQNMLCFAARMVSRCCLKFVRKWWRVSSFSSVAYLDSSLVSRSTQFAPDPCPFLHQLLACSSLRSLPADVAGVNSIRNVSRVCCAIKWQFVASTCFWIWSGERG